MVYNFVENKNGVECWTTLIRNELQPKKEKKNGIDYCGLPFIYQNMLLFHGWQYSIGCQPWIVCLNGDWRLMINAGFVRMNGVSDHLFSECSFAKEVWGLFCNCVA